MLRSVRQAQAQSVEELSNRTDLGPDVLGRYELGEQAIPFTHLSVLAQVLSQDLSYFRETLSDERDGDPIAKVSRSLVEDENAGEERPTADEHAALIRLAIAFRDIDRQNLQRVSDALSALIMARDASGPVGGSD